MVHDSGSRPDRVKFNLESYEPELCDLDVEETQGGSDTLLPLNVSLTFGFSKILSERVEVTFGIKRAYVKICVEGGEIDNSSRLANRQKPMQVQYDLRHEAELSSGKKVGAGAVVGVSSVGAKAELRANAEKGVLARKIQSESYASIHDRVLALPNGRWKIQEIRGGLLEGKYLGDDNICDIIIDKNQGDVVTEICFSVSDIIVIDCCEINTGRLLPNKDRQVRAVIEVLLKKEIQQKN